MRVETAADSVLFLFGLRGKDFRLKLRPGQLRLLEVRHRGEHGELHTSRRYTLGLKFCKSPRCTASSGLDAGTVGFGANR